MLPFKYSNKLHICQSVFAKQIFPTGKILEKSAYWGKGIAAEALRRFLDEITVKYNLLSVGAFTYSANAPSIRVLLKYCFQNTEILIEDGVESRYFQKDIHPSV